MTRDQILDDLHSLRYTACVNQRYHQALADRYSSYDRRAKLVVAGFTTLGVAMISVKTDWVNYAATVASFAAAAVLNVFPFGDSEKKYQSLFVRWTELRKDIEALDYDVRARGEEPPADSHVMQLTRINDKRHEIEADEPSPDEELLRKSQNDLNRTNADYQSPQPTVVETQVAVPV